MPVLAIHPLMSNPLKEVPRTKRRSLSWTVFIGIVFEAKCEETPYKLVDSLNWIVDLKCVGSDRIVG